MRDRVFSRLAAAYLAILALGPAAPACSQEGFSPFTTDFPKEEFAARRNAPSACC